MAEYTKPVPFKSAFNAPYFEGALEGRIRLQQGRHTGRFHFPPNSPFDPIDLSDDGEWKDTSGRATLWSWIVFHQVYFPSFKDDVPYPVIFVQLEEGPFLISTIADGVDVASLEIDMPLQAEFDRVTDEFALLKFRPVPSAP